MPQYYYQAQNANHEPAVGQLEADSLAQAIAQLEAQGLSIQSIGTTPPPAPPPAAPPPASPPANPAPIAHPPPDTEAARQSALQLHLARVIERARDILPALQAYAQELPRGRRRWQLETVLSVLERGDASQAVGSLAKLPGYWIPLLGAATASRDPGRILREFLEESQRAEDLQRQWWLALAYPLLVGCVAATVLTAISIFVIPTFRDIFAGFGLRVPVFTQFVLSVAEWIASGRVLLVIAGIVAAGIFLRWAARFVPVSVGNWWSDRVGLAFGRTTAIARFCQFTADLLEGELPLAQTVRLAGIATGRAPICRAAWRVADDLDSGAPLNQPANRQVLTATVLLALNPGTPDAARIRLLREISAGYAERSRFRLSWTRGLVEPLAICAIGLLVGATVLAMFLPLVALIQGLT